MARSATQPLAVLKTPAQEAAVAHHAEACMAAYERRRTWSRTDSARWLNDRSAPVLALLRRRQGQWPAHSRSLGYWLKEHTPDLFLSAHAVLAAEKNDDARDALLPQQVLP